MNVLIVDDEPLARDRLQRMVASLPDFNVVAMAETGQQAIQQARDTNPDVVLMDAKMPGIGGLEATRKLLRNNADVRVIAVTACGEEPFPSRFLQAGASGYLTKGAAMDEMVKAIRLVHSGQRYISPDVAQELALKPFRQDSASPFDQLSEREMQIAMMIVNCQKVQEISEMLFLSPKTVNSYRYRLFEKLGINSDVELTLLAVRHGMLDVESLPNN